jgi:predicted phage replisome organizer
MSDIKWIKIVTDIFDDEKILLIETLPEADSIIVIWFKLLCLAGKQNNNGVFMMGDKIPYSDKMLATIFRRKESTIQLALTTFEQFGMIEKVDDVIVIPQWGKHQNFDKIEKNNEYQRNYMREYREKQKLLACKPNSNINSKPNSKPNVRALEENRIEENRKEKKIQNIIPPELEWVEKYCEERKNEIDVEKFMNHYTSNGWQIGKSKMKDWQATIRTWEKNRNVTISEKKEVKKEEVKIESRFGPLTDSERKAFFDRGAFYIENDADEILECVDFGKLTEEERKYLHEKGVI